MFIFVEAFRKVTLQELEEEFLYFTCRLDKPFLCYRYPSPIYKMLEQIARKHKLTQVRFHYHSKKMDEDKRDKEILAIVDAYLVFGKAYKINEDPFTKQFRKLGKKVKVVS
jgi:hypothetical protein